MAYTLDDLQAAASMRPPQNAGEDNEGDDADNRRDDASMRPPQNAGEDQCARARPCRASASFNETPAERGGRRFMPPVIRTEEASLQ